MVSKRKYILTIVAVVLVTAFLTLTLGNVLLVEIGQKVFLSKDEYSQLKKISEKYAKQESIMKIAQNEFLYEADEEVMLEGALQGTLKALGDPYTQFLTKEEFESLMQDTEGSYEGIGVYITAGDDNKIIIVSPIEDTPAEKAGLRTGDKIYVRIGFDSDFAKKIYSGADLFLMPSISEPCGIAQMISSRYGTVPIVRETGGLKDSIKDASLGKGNGFTFVDETPQALCEAVKRALIVYEKKEDWKKLVETVMKMDFSWRKSAEKYFDLYSSLANFEENNNEGF
jgi:carboxyl-terminal processing protease